VNGATLSREEKIVEARRLKAADGLNSIEIGERLSAPPSTVRNWLRGALCECGAPITGCSGSKSSSRCESCASIASRLWSPQRIIEKIREWHRLFGDVPTATEWNLALSRSQHSAARHAEVESRHEGAKWPGTQAVIERFGSWNAAIAAAGFTPLQTGKQRHQRESV
jgi:Homing endonuclease associated repeat